METNPTVYLITNDRYAPDAVEATAEEVRAMCADNDWNVTLTERDGELIDDRGEVVGTAVAA